MSNHNTHSKAIKSTLKSMLDITKCSTLGDVTPVYMEHIAQLNILGKLMFAVDRPVLYVDNVTLHQLKHQQGFEALDDTNTITTGDITAVFDVPALRALWDSNQEAIAHRVMTESFLVRTTNQNNVYLPGVIHCADLDELLVEFEDLTLQHPNLPTDQKVIELNKLLEQEDHRFRVIDPYPANSTKWGHWQIKLVNE